MKLFGFEIWRRTKETTAPHITETIKETAPLAKQPDKVQLPVNGGRETVPEGTTTLGALFRELSAIEPDFEIKLLQVLEYLAKYNADLSYAIANIKDLGNTTYSIKFDETVPDSLQKEIKSYLESKRKQWYSHSGGDFSLINDLLTQAAINGCISAENIPFEDLSGIKKVVLVAPSSIKFVYDRETDEYKPHQTTSTMIGTFSGLRPLNEITYKYIALQRHSEKPYAIPPFLSALESISIEKYMMENFKHIVKQLGVFGFLEVLLTPPPKRMNTTLDGPPETEAQYEEKCRQYINSVSPEIQKALSTGYVVGFEGTHTFDMKGNLSNPQGAIDLLKMNTEIKMAGLKQDPLMLGRNFSTTETIGRVLLTKLSAQIVNYQKLSATFLEALFLIDVNLAGFNITNLKVEFEKPILSDQVKDEQAFALRIANGQQLYNDGILSQQERANYLGYDMPAEDKPILSKEGTPIVINDGAATSPANTSNAITREDIESLEIELGSLIKPYQYHSDCGCGGSECNKSSFTVDWNDPKMQKFFDSYDKDSKNQYQKAVNKQTKKIAKELAKLGVGASEQQVTDLIIYNLYKDWKVEFSEPQKKIITKWVTQTYKVFRTDKDIVASIKPIPETTFGLVDMRTIEYFKSSDDLYMGKFITDPDTRKRMTEYIKNKYVAGNIPLGGSKAAMEDFRAEFGNLLIGEDWKITRIISTTTNKLRNYAAVGTMTEAEVDYFKIVGVNDRLQCDYCKAMQGKRFSVSKAQERINSFVKSDPSYVSVESKLINQVYKGEEGLKTLQSSTSEQIQAAGIDVPSFHMNCRDSVVVDI